MEAEPHAVVAVVRVMFPVHPVAFVLKSYVTVGVIWALVVPRNAAETPIASSGRFHHGVRRVRVGLEF